MRDSFARAIRMAHSLLLADAVLLLPIGYVPMANLRLVNTDAI